MFKPYFSSTESGCRLFGCQALRKKKSSAYRMVFDSKNKVKLLSTFIEWTVSARTFFEVSPIKFDERKKSIISDL